jgi:hypothetical protein
VDSGALTEKRPGTGGVTRLEMWAAVERRLAFVRREMSCMTDVLLRRCRGTPPGGVLPTAG